MPTKSFRELAQEHGARDPEFATALVQEGVRALLSGDQETGVAVLRDYARAKNIGP